MAKSLMGCCFVGAVVCLFGLASHVRADTWHVPGDFTTIQAAIDAATDGDEVIVGPGTYNENLVIEFKAITLASVGGAGITTVVAADSNEPVLQIAIIDSDDPVTVDGFTFTGGRGGVEIAFALAVVENCIIIENPDGSGIDSFFSDATIRDCEIAFNGGSNVRGGGILTELGVLSLFDTTIEHNRGWFGGGVDVIETLAEIDACIFRENEAENGGGIFVGLADVSIVDTVFTKNIALDGGGGIEVADALGTTVEILDSRLRGNRAPEGGGMLVGLNALVMIGGTRFCDNEENNITGTFTDLGGNHFDEDCLAFGDFNLDGDVDTTDLLLLLANWGKCPPNGECIADLNNDGVVDHEDLQILLDNWG